MIKVETTDFVNSDSVMVQMSIPKDEWEKIQKSEEWKRILECDVAERIPEKSATEETLQSIDSTLKRIEKLLLALTRPVSIEFSKGNTDDLVKENT